MLTLNRLPSLEVCNNHRDEYFLNKLLQEWNTRELKGLFRYNVHACQIRILRGNEYRFIAQLNEGRHLKKRPTEFTQVDKVLQDFDHKKFNFTKIAQEEVLFRLEDSVIAINVSPIEYGHVLLIPNVLDCYPQRIDRDSFLLAMYMARKVEHPYFRLGYNSLGAFATINHLHFQAYYLSLEFPIEVAPTQEITTTDNNVKISKLLNYPVRGFVFEGGNSIEDLSITVSDSCICLQENNIPYDVLIVDSGKRIFLLPQCYAEKQAAGEVSEELLETQVNPAVWEISGHLVFKREKDYKEASEEKVWKLLAEVSLDENRFEKVKKIIFQTIAIMKPLKQNLKRNACIYRVTWLHYSVSRSRVVI